MLSRACNHHDAVSNTVEVRCMSHRKTYSPAWGTRALLLALPEDGSSNNRPMNMYVVQAVYSMVVLKEEAASPSVSEWVIENDEVAADDGSGDSNDVYVGVDSSDDVDYCHVEAKNDGAKVVQVPVQGAHDSAQTNDFDNVRGLNARCMVKQADSDDTASGDANTIHASLDMGTEEGPRPKKAWVS